MHVEVSRKREHADEDGEVSKEGRGERDRVLRGHHRLKRRKLREKRETDPEGGRKRRRRVECKRRNNLMKLISTPKLFASVRR